MNTIDNIFSESRNAKDFSTKYSQYIITLIQNLDHNAVDEVASLLLDARSNGKKILFLGNGGSAATASHFANDLGIGPKQIDNPFKALSLTDNIAIMTAIGNDTGYDEIFLQQLYLYMEEGDIVVAISASGNSPNLLKAISYANKKGNTTIGLLGFDGGNLSEICKSIIHIKTPKGEYGPVEDMHMILDHLLANYLMRIIN